MRSSWPDHRRAEFTTALGGARRPTSGVGGSPVPLRADDDPALISVAAYSEHAASYAATHAGKWAEQVERFASSLAGPVADPRRWMRTGP